MGLDMYLEVEQHVSDYEEKDEPLVESIKQNAVDGLNEFRPKSITFELAYWRKANAIHNWFVKNVQDGEDKCQTAHVTLERLKDLKETCERVLANIELADELLPTKSGFFFGSTEYNEYYKDDLERTVHKLNKILSNPNAKKWWITYQASW